MMQLRLAALLVMFVLASVMTGCASTASPGGASSLDSNHHWLMKQPVMAATMVDGEVQHGSVESSPTESVKRAILDFLSILGDETLRQPGRRKNVAIKLSKSYDTVPTISKCPNGAWQGLGRRYARRNSRNLSACSFSS